VRLDGQRADSDLPPPGLGEHSREILSDLSDEEFERLREAGVVG
jgi:crotonobetainyl-CoA:carnitine CoA-transferase CaiB-like acyl-CoA transferase